MSLRCIFYVFAAAILSMQPCPTIAQTGLPPSVQADILKSEIVDAFESDRPAEALAALDKYHTLEISGEQLPPILHFYEAKAAERTGDLGRAYEALERYLQVAERTQKTYSEAIRWYRDMTSNQVTMQAVGTRRAELAALEVKRKHKEAEAQAIARKQREKEKRESPFCKTLHQGKYDAMSAFNDCHPGFLSTTKKCAPAQQRMEDAANRYKQECGCDPILTPTGSCD